MLFYPLPLRGGILVENCVPIVCLSPLSRTSSHPPPYITNIHITQEAEIVVHLEDSWFVKSSSREVLRVLDFLGNTTETEAGDNHNVMSGWTMKVHRYV